ncbi:MAG: SPFH domain-containing protein [Methylococcales bacterium]|nr:SPFH domain-containing protein [Methylococcales bacterium]
MALLDGLKRQLRSVIEWNNPPENALFSQWTDNGDEIKNASKLIVGPGQGCIFVYRGRIKSIIEQECIVNLTTDNIPFWTTIKSLMQFFESEHKVCIYFYRTHKILDQKWGTTSAIKYDDPKYKFPVGLKSYGNYTYRLTNSKEFFLHIAGSHTTFYIDDLRETLSARIIPTISDYLAEGKFSYAEIDAHRDEIAKGIHLKLAATFKKLGLNITDFRIEGTDFDTETLRRINRIADLTAEAQAANAVGLDYTKFQQLEAMKAAAENESGAAGLGMGMGAGIGLGQNMAQSMQEPTPPPVESEMEKTIHKLKQLKQMFETELITAQEYSAKKQSLLEKI